MGDVEKTVLKNFYDNYNLDTGEFKDGPPIKMDVSQAYGPDISHNYLKRKALIDPSMMENKNYDHSLAHNKYYWHGQNGNYKSEDIAPWFQIYNQTYINDLDEVLEPTMMRNLNIKL